MTVESIDLWYASVVVGTSHGDAEFVQALLHETPTMMSVTFERACNLQCAHCLYPAERSSRGLSEAADLPGIVRNLAGQVQSVLHEGRTLRPWHLDVFCELRQTYPGLALGLIDNGSYVKLLSEFCKRDFRLDWLDISLDGMEAAHNLQRRSPRAWSEAISGLKQAREVTLPRGKGGRVAALFTLTKLNYYDIEEVGHFLLDDGLADEFCIVPMTPVRPQDADIAVGVDELRVAWQRVVRLTWAFGSERVTFKIYHLEDLLALSEVVGHELMWRAISDCRVNVGRIIFRIRDVPVTYFPPSVWPNETFLVDADGSCRVAHSMKYTLAELQQGRSATGTDISAYTVGPLDATSDLPGMYALCVDQWWRFFGTEALAQEIAVFRRIAERAGC